MRTLIPAAALTAAALLAAGCGADEVRTEPGPGAEGSGGSPGAAPDTELTIDITATESAGPSAAPGGSPSPSPSAPARWTLTCAPAGGDHPDPEAACADLADAGGADAFAEVPDNQPCTFIYGGPQVARVEGHVEGTPVETEFTRSGGCEIDRYDTMGAVLAP
ncbi:subtilase-type protease inhibitor [Streptomonospora sp. S1-112]|uniref:Subtilase-type protease inhibitor n=1 Tax=Streptomonospora mangrovi TaxID=2883123 RepID=A0A9X3NJH3_9ACTN|nr:SSI family serine proteinase inhibitor [Streptomonospora mangrovi]MDA0564632.1 subtilase-type protease inhibitor [Streptomonospora mangrovi]